MSRASRSLRSILFTDIVGSTGRAAELGDARWRELLAEHHARARAAIARHGGREANTAGDAFLATFDRPTAALSCAWAMRESMREIGLEIRAGVHVGEVEGEGADLAGVAVHAGARIAAAAAPGEILASRTARELAAGGGFEFEERGERELRGLPGTWSLHAMTGAPEEPEVRPETEEPGPPAEQEIRFCTTSDGVRIAYAAVGSGPPVVKAANWLNHLEFDWVSPVWRHLLWELSRHYLFVRYDERGNGVSDWNVDDISFEAFVRDLEEVVDATGLERFSLLGISQGCPVSIAYAVRHPERVRRLVLHGGYAAGWRVRAGADEIRWREGLLEMARSAWGREEPAFRQVFGTLYVPGGTPEQQQWFSDLQRLTSAENAIRLQEAFSRIDVRPLLPRVAAPTLVLHSRNDAVVPLAAGRELAGAIPGARFTVLESANHIVLEQEPAWPRFIETVRGFLGEEKK